MARFALPLALSLAAACAGAPPDPAGPEAPLSAGDRLQRRLEQAVADLAWDRRAEGRPLRRGREAWRPRVFIGTPVVIGDQETVYAQRVVHDQRAAFTACYERALLATPGLSGPLRADFLVLGDGQVSKVVITGEAADEQLKTCLDLALRAQPFRETNDVTRVYVDLVVVPPEPDEDVSKALPRAEQRWPVLQIGAEGARLNGRLLYDAAAESPSIDALSDALATERARWGELHPREIDPRVVGLRLADDAKPELVASVLTELGRRRYDRLVLQRVSSPDELELVTLRRARLPDGDRDDIPMVLHARLGREPSFVWWRGVAVVFAEPSSTSSLEERICRAWRSHGEHRRPDDEETDTLVLEVTRGAEVPRIFELARAVSACRRQRPTRTGGVAPQPVFRIELATDKLPWVDD